MKQADTSRAKTIFLLLLLAAATSAHAWEFINLRPDGFVFSEARAVAGNAQVGFVQHPSSGRKHASLWYGSAASWVDLTPAGSTEWWSEALAVDGSVQVGYAAIDAAGGYNHAGFWTGSAESWVDLHPAEALDSKATGVHNGQIVGEVRLPGNQYRAALWTTSG